MKIKIYTFLIICSILFTNCSNDDDAPQTSAIIGQSISFVNEDGTVISLFDCINPSENYYVRVKVAAEGPGDLVTSAVRYTFNGAVFSMTFKTLESQTNPVTLREGENIAQLENTGFTARLSYIITSSEFELVP